jgi:hypothetical protein
MTISKDNQLQQMAIQKDFWGFPYTYPTQQTEHKENCVTRTQTTQGTPYPPSLTSRVQFMDVTSFTTTKDCQEWPTPMVIVPTHSMNYVK